MYFFYHCPEHCNCNVVSWPMLAFYAKNRPAQYPNLRKTQYYPNAFIANLVPYCFDTCLFYTKISFLHILITVIEMTAINEKHTATHSPLLRDNIRHSQWFDAELVALCRIDWYGQHFSSVYFLNPEGHL